MISRFIRDVITNDISYSHDYLFLVNDKEKTDLVVKGIQKAQISKIQALLETFIVEYLDKIKQIKY